MKRIVVLGSALLLAGGAPSSYVATAATVPNGSAAHAVDQHQDTAARSLIFGSDETSLGRHPYMASLLTAAGRPYCAGTLIAPNVVLSAAHCADEPGKPASVIIGRHSREDYADEEGVEEFEVSRIIIHPYHRNGFNYINDHLLHDVVLVQFDGVSQHRPIALNFDPTVPSVPILGTKDQKKLTVMGWGAINSNKDRPDVLMSAKVNYIPNQICEESSGKIWSDLSIKRNYNEYITMDMLCAAAPGRDSCSGDSGGPLIIEGKNAKKDVQVGVVSWGYSCASENFPGVYARLSYQRDWIVRELCNGDQFDSTYPSWCNDVGEIPTFPPTQVPPTPAPTVTPKCLSLELKFDNYPEEVGWSIQPVDVEGSSKSADDEGAMFTRVPGYYRDLKQQKVVEEICLDDYSQRNSKFSFVLVDRRGDGMMSGDPGQFSITNDEGSVLAKGDGNFKLVKMETMEIGLVSDSANDYGGGSVDGDAKAILVQPEEDDKRMPRPSKISSAQAAATSGAHGRRGGATSTMIAFGASALLLVLSTEYL